MLRNARLAVTAFAAAAIPAASCLAGAGIPSMDTVRVAGGGGAGGTLTKPLFVTYIPGDNSRVFIVEQRGLPSATQARIMVLDITQSPPVLQATPFAIVSGLSTNDEQGLLGLAFDPNYMTNGRFYIYYTNASQDILQRWTDANPNDSVYTAAPGSPSTLLSWTDPESNHNGGWLAFGPDGYLYLSVGDGGGANDQHTQNCPTGNGQCLTTFLGKIHRLDVSTAAGYAIPPGNPFVGVAGNDEIWAYGLRNPWRPSFDRLTGQLYIADVGQGAQEEINVQPVNTSETVGAVGYQGGKNYGWRCMEGFNCTGMTGCTCNATNLTLPIFNYAHTLGRCSITGGYVYRGTAIPGLQGNYFYADYCGNQIYSFKYTGTINPPVTDRTAELAPGGGLSITAITSFGEDNAGEIYICDRNGEVYKIVPTPPANNSCGAATLVAEGTAAFTTFAATTDGPDEAGCTFGDPTQIKNDAWYRFVASCTGTGRVSICDADFDTRLAIYGASCPTGPGSVLACNDDSCGTGSEVTFAVVQGQEYRIRVGSASGATGSGNMVISCEQPPPPCTPDITGNGEVDVDDLFAVINAWGTCPKGDPCDADVTDNGEVDVDDLFVIINGWGACQ